MLGYIYFEIFTTSPKMWECFFWLTIFVSFAYRFGIFSIVCKCARSFFHWRSVQFRSCSLHRNQNCGRAFTTVFSVFAFGTENFLRVCVCVYAWWPKAVLRNAEKSSVFCVCVACFVKCYAGVLSVICLRWGRNVLIEMFSVCCPVRVCMCWCVDVCKFWIS